VESHLLGLGFGLVDAGVARGSCQGRLPVGLGVGRLADVDLELLLLLLGFELGDPGLLLDDRLARPRLGQRPLLLGLLRRLIDLGLVAGLLDLGASDRFGSGLRRLSWALPVGPVRPRSGRSVRPRPDVGRRVLDRRWARDLLDRKASMTSPNDSISWLQRSGPAARTCPGR
jgi:hypothetical protein